MRNFFAKLYKSVHLHIWVLWNQATLSLVGILPDKLFYDFGCYPINVHTIARIIHDYWRTSTNPISSATYSDELEVETGSRRVQGCKVVKNSGLIGVKCSILYHRHTLSECCTNNFVRCCMSFTLCNHHLHPLMTLGTKSDIRFGWFCKKRVFSWKYLDSSRERRIINSFLLG